MDGKPRPPGSTPGGTIAAEVSMILLVATLAMAADPMTHTFEPNERTLDLTSAAGSVSISTGGDRIKVTAQHAGDETMCAMTTNTDDGATVHYAARGYSSIERECIANFTVTVPSGVGVHVALKKGDLEVMHDGSIAADLGTGSIKGKITAPSNLNVGTGNIGLGGLTMPIEVKVGKGHVALVYDKAPVGSILVTVGAGDIYLDLPDGTEVDARVPPGVNLPHPQKTSAGTKLLIGKSVGTIEIE
jgi:hypothetical protein